MKPSSWNFYNTLRGLCYLHGLPVHDVSPRTLYNWSVQGVSYDHIDLLCYRLIFPGYLSSESVFDIALSCGVDPAFFTSLSDLVQCRAPGSSGPAPSNGSTGVADT